jgi:hypothetical protein
MFWLIEKGRRSLTMAEPAKVEVKPEVKAPNVPHLIVNRAEVVLEGCSACGNGFAANPQGERALTAVVGDNNAYMFCAHCGDAIMGHVQSDSVRQRYAWDWVVPLKGAPMLNGKK